MSVFDPIGLATVLGRDQRLLGLDLGSKTIGLALSDTMLIIATPRHYYYKLKT